MESSKQTAHPDTQTLFGEALNYQRAGRLEEAGRIYRQILSVEPRHADCLHLLGTIAHRSGQLDAASALIRQAINLRNNIPIYHSNLAHVLKDHVKLEEAIEHYRRALDLKPTPQAHYNLGCALHAQGKFAEAAASYECAIALQPKLVEAHINLGNANKDQGRTEEAIQHYERALEIDPDNADAHYNLATALKDQDRFEESAAHYRRTLGARPNHVSAHNNLGVLLQDRGDFAAALQHFRAATAINPNYAESHVNEAMILLQSGNLAKGWAKYEWRWRIKGAKPLETAKPPWDGGDLKGKTILLHGEQGLGDCLQFIRYAPLVKERGARILLKCPSALSRLFQTMNAIDQIIPKTAPMPDYDCHAPLMSLPHLFGTTLDTIPDSVPYISPPKDGIMAWAQKLQGISGLKVGLVWAGHSRRNHPAAHAVDRRRSMHISQFAPLASVPGVRFFSLQKGDPARQLETPLPDFAVTDYMDEVEDFADTAALIANLDLVIGVDTSVVHLAGAMGKPVWVLSRFDGCWRWLLDRGDSPWYPTMRLFRQARIGDWQSVVENVRTQLNCWERR